MGIRRSVQKLQKILQLSLKTIWKVLIIPLVMLVLTWVWDAITSKYVGNPILDSIEKYILYFSKKAPPILAWAINYPVQATVALFFIVSSIIVVTVYFQNLDFKGVFIDKKVIYSVSKTYRDTGFSVINSMGEELENCTIYISKINNEEIAGDYHNYLRWGASSEVYSNKEKINIPNTEKGIMYLNQIKGYVKSKTSEDKFFGIHEVELIFNSNTKTGKSYTIIIWCVLKIGQMEVGGFTQERLLLEKVET